MKESFAFMKTAQVEAKAKKLASGLLNLGLVPEISEFEDYTLRFVGIYSQNSIEWALIDIASALYGFTTVPIYDTLGEEATREMFEQTNMTTCFLTSNHLQGVVNSFKKGQTGKLKNIIIMDYKKMRYTPGKYSRINSELEELKSSGKLNVYLFNEIVKSGESNMQSLPKVTPASIFTLSYTSGTTGSPKGAMISHGNAIATVCNPTVVDIKCFHVSQHFYLSYLPMAHVMERMAFLKCIYLNGVVGIFSGDILKIREDCEILKPTIFLTVPRLFNKMHDAIKNKFSKETGIKKLMIDQAIKTKMDNFERTGAVTHWLWDKLLFNKIKDLLGGNVVTMGVGSAPMSVDTLKFLKIAFCCNISEGYGQTEGLGMQFQMNSQDT